MKRRLRRRFIKIFSFFGSRARLKLPKRFLHLHPPTKLKQSPSRCTLASHKEQRDGCKEGHGPHQSGFTFKDQTEEVQTVLNGLHRSPIQCRG